MKTSTLYIRFNTINKRLNKKGLIAIQCRITFNKKRKDFATGLFVDPKDWDSKKQKLLDGSDLEETVKNPIDASTLEVRKWMHENIK